MGFRYLWRFGSGGSPYDCGRCGYGERRARNCNNWLGLSEGARAVQKYTADVVAELGQKGAEKVLSLGDIRLYECPLSYISVDSWQIIEYIGLVEGTGNLPLDGGWADQPCWFVEAYGLYLKELERWQSRGQR